MDRDDEPGSPVTGDEATAAWELQNSPYTIEGELEGFQRFGTGVRQSSGAKRMVGLLLVAAILVPMVFGVLSLVYNALF